MHVFLCTMWVLGDDGDQKMASNSLEMKIRDGFKLPCGYWEAIPNPLQEYQLFLIIKSSLQSPRWCWYWMYGEKLRPGIICQVWHPWREAIDEDVASVEVETPDVPSLSKTAADVKRRLAWTYDMSYLFCRNRDREVEIAMKTPWSPENYKWVPDITLYTVEAWLWCDLAVIVPWFFPRGTGSI